MENSYTLSQILTYPALSGYYFDHDSSSLVIRPVKGRVEVYRREKDGSVSLLEKNQVKFDTSYIKGLYYVFHPYLSKEEIVPALLEGKILATPDRNIFHRLVLQQRIKWDKKRNVLLRENADYRWEECVFSTTELLNASWKVID
jgi:hypothetical protein